MQFEGSRFQVGQLCPAAPYCKADVAWATINGVRHPFDAAPSADGVFQLRDTGAPEPAAVRLTASAQFGKQGTLHKQHRCLEMQRRR